MTKGIEDVTLDDIIRVFWEAMENGWCSEGEVKKEIIPGFPGYKGVQHTSEDFSVLDMYSTNSFNNMSEGKIIIWFKDIVVWVMNYGGEYPKEVIPFVKLAMRNSLDLRIFFGGRGPQDFMHSEFPEHWYTNTPQKDRILFYKFAGREEVGIGDELIGYHDYSGGACI